MAKKKGRAYDPTRNIEAFYAASKAAQKHFHKPSLAVGVDGIGYFSPARKAPENYVCSECGAPWADDHECAAP